MEKIELGYDDVRALAKKIGGRVNRQIKHTDILNDIGSLFGMHGDALMHSLKQADGRTRNAAACEQSFNKTLNLDTKETFVNKVETSISNAITDYTVMIGVINLYSYDRVLSDAGQAAADQHLQVFAESIRPHSMFSDRGYAHLEGCSFLVGWPELDHEITMERRVKNAIVYQDRRLEIMNGAQGTGSTAPFEYTVGLYTEKGSRIKLQEAISISTQIANRLSRVRVKYPFMHQFDFHY